jgi:hypothetical protein
MGKRNKFWIFPLLLLGFMLTLINNCETGPTTAATIPPDSTSDTIGSIPAGWTKVGDFNANDMIWSLTFDGSGNLYAAGYFTNANGYHYVAKWDGTMWSELGNLNANSSISSLTTDAGGNVYAAGAFTNGITPDGGNPYVAQWDGGKWNDIGGEGGPLTADAIGNIYTNTSKWNGSVWSYTCPSCSLNMLSGSFNAFVSNAAGTMHYTGGSFQHENGYRYVVKCDGSNCWSELGSLNANNNIEALATDANGNVYAAGLFTNGNLPSTGYYYVAKWNGTTWNELGSLNANGDIYYLAIDNKNGFLYASGYFHNSNGGSIAKWDGTTWSGLETTRLSPAPILVDASGKLYSVVASSNGKKFWVVVHE